jgi:lysophospholipase L1-like esterase
MTRLLLSPLCALLLLGSARGAERTAEPPPGVAQLVGKGTPLRAGMKIAFYGDSITMQGGYIEVLRKALAASPDTKDLKVQLLQHGLNGGRVPTLLEGQSPWGKLGGTLPELLAKEKPDVVVLFVGVNDVWHGEKGTTPEEFEAGLKKIAALCRESGARVVLATPAVIGEKPDGGNEHDQKLDQYSAIVLKTAAEAKAASVDLRKAFVDYLKTHNATKDAKGQYPRQGILTYDGVHLSAKGNELVADLIAQGICAALGHRAER